MITGKHKYFHPPKDEIEYLYLELKHSLQEIANVYDIPRNIVEYLIYSKYKISQTTERQTHRRKITGERHRERKLQQLEKQGFTKEKLRELYIDRKLSPQQISDLYDGLERNYVSRLLDVFKIPKRTHSEIIKMVWKTKNEKKAKERSKTFMHQKIDEIRKKIKNHVIDPKKLSHVDVCKLLSCEPGIEKLEKMCDIYGYDFVILSNTYRKLEQIWYNLNLYPNIYVKIALSLYLRYEITQGVVCEICKVTTVSFRQYYTMIKKIPILKKEKRSDPLLLTNISYLF